MYGSRFRGAGAEDHGQEEDLDGDDARDAPFEDAVAGLVAEGLHSCVDTDAASGDRSAQQHLFRDPPLSAAGFLLVDMHKQEAQCIDYDEVTDDVFHEFEFLSGGIDVKRIIWLVLTMTVLWGCAAQETFETVGDDVLAPVMGPMRQVVLALPSEAATPVMGDGDGSMLYLCDGYSLAVQTLEGGDIHATIRDLSGFDMEALTVMKTVGDDADRYEWVWSAVGEGGDQLCRAAVLDDGSYHYCLTAIGDAELEDRYQLQWEGVFGSFALE